MQDAAEGQQEPAPDVPKPLVTMRSLADAQRFAVQSGLSPQASGVSWNLHAAWLHQKEAWCICLASTCASPAHAAESQSLCKAGSLATVQGTFWSFCRHNCRKHTECCTGGLPRQGSLAPPGPGSRPRQAPPASLPASPVPHPQDGEAGQAKPPAQGLGPGSPARPPLMGQGSLRPPGTPGGGPPVRCASHPMPLRGAWHPQACSTGQ